MKGTKGAKNMNVKIGYKGYKGCEGHEGTKGK